MARRSLATARRARWANGSSARVSWASTWELCTAAAARPSSPAAARCLTAAARATLCAANRKLKALNAKNNGNCIIYETSGGDDKSWDPKSSGSGTVVDVCCSKKSGSKTYYMAQARVQIKCGHKSTVYKFDQSFGPV